MCIRDRLAVGHPVSIYKHPCVYLAPARRGNLTQLGEAGPKAVALARFMNWPGVSNFKFNYFGTMLDKENQ